jgi:hypothetical protein
VRGLEGAPWLGSTAMGGRTAHRSALAAFLALAAAPRRCGGCAGPARSSGSGCRATARRVSRRR